MRSGGFCESPAFEVGRAAFDEEAGQVSLRQHRAEGLHDARGELLLLLRIPVNVDMEFRVMNGENGAFRQLICGELSLRSRFHFGTP